MTTQTADAPASLSGFTARATFREALDSEWAKIRTVRSTYWTLITVLVVSVGISLAIAAAYTSQWNSLTADQRAQVDISFALSGVNFGVLVIAVLGVMVISTEYSTGMIRTSLTALPRRVQMLTAKLTVLAGISLVLGLVVAFASYAVTEPFYAGKGVHLTLSQSGNLRAVLLAGVYLAMVAMIGFALGAILRHTAGAITSTLGVMFVLPIITGFLPGTWGHDLNKVMPSNAGAAMTRTSASASANDALSPLGGFIVLAVIVAALCAIAFTLFKRRDA